MFIVNMPMSKNCLDCMFCQGEYGPGNEKSYCALHESDTDDIELKYKGRRPKNCPIIEYKENHI